MSGLLLIVLGVILSGLSASVLGAQLRGNPLGLLCLFSLVFGIAILVTGAIWWTGRRR